MGIKPVMDPSRLTPRESNLLNEAKRHVAKGLASFREARRIDVELKADLDLFGNEELFAQFILMGKKYRKAVMSFNEARWSFEDIAEGAKVQEVRDEALKAAKRARSIRNRVQDLNRRNRPGINLGTRPTRDIVPLKKYL